MNDRTAPFFRSAQDALTNAILELTQERELQEANYCNVVADIKLRQPRYKSGNEDFLDEELFPGDFTTRAKRSVSSRAVDCQPRI